MTVPADLPLTHSKHGIEDTIGYQIHQTPASQKRDFAREKSGDDAQKPSRSIRPPRSALEAYHRRTQSFTLNVWPSRRFFNETTVKPSP